MGRSRSRSRSRGRGGYGRRRRSYSRSRSRSVSPYEGGHRVHVADIGLKPCKTDVLEIFEKFGPITEVWVAQNPPCFAFVVFRRIEDAERAIRDCNGKYVSAFSSRIRVSLARPRTRGLKKRHGFDPNLRCYQCGEKGHFSRDCSDVARERRRARSRSRSHSPKRRDRPKRSRSRSRKRTRSRSRDQERKPNKKSSRSKSDHKSKSRSKSNERGKTDNGHAASPAKEGSTDKEDVQNWKTLDSED